MTDFIDLPIPEIDPDALGPNVGERFPDVVLPDQHGNMINLHEHRGGRKALFVNGNFTTRIDQLSEAESRQVLDLLFGHVQDPVFQCRFRWTDGTLTLWDNRCLQHYAVPDYDGRRVMHRLTISGDRPV